MSNSSGSRLTHLFNSCFTPALLATMATGLSLLTAGGLSAASRFQVLQQHLERDLQLQRISTAVLYDTDMLSLSARAAVSGELAWKGRYEAYESRLQELIVKAEAIAPADEALFETVKGAAIALVNIEKEALLQLQNGNSQQAIALLQNETYRAIQETYASRMHAWDEALQSRIQTGLNTRSDIWAESSYVTGTGLLLLLVAWACLLARLSYYSLARYTAERGRRHANRQMEAHRQDIQKSQAALLQKNAALETTLAKLHQTQSKLAQSHQQEQVAKAALSQKAATSEEMVDELQITKFALASSHKELQVAKAALSQKAATLETLLDELQHTQVQMVQSEKMSSLGQLVAGVAHEVNNPINFIYANLEPVREYTRDLLSLVAEFQTQYPSCPLSLRTQMEAADLEFIREDLPKVIDSMEVGTERIRQIVLSLQNFSRSDESGLKPANIHDGLESTLLILQHRLNPRPGYSAIEVRYEYGDIPVVECYPGLVNQVLMNLFSNAIDALDEMCDRTGDGQRGSITLRTQKIEQKDGTEWVEIAIADTGIGIAEVIQDRVFDAFFTTKPVGKGTGIGLSISYSIITKKHDGRLTFSSELYKGTEFVVQLPVLKTAVPVETPAFILQPPMQTASVRGQAAEFVL